MNKKQSAKKRIIINGLLTVSEIKLCSDNLIEISFKSSKPLPIEDQWIGPHMTLLFPDQNGDLAFPTINQDNQIIWQDGAQERVRIYSVREYDVKKQILSVIFVIHDQGKATNWARNAKINDVIGIIGLGAKSTYDIDKQWILAGDLSALPAICYTLEHAPAQQQILAFIEIKNKSDIQTLNLPANANVNWLIQTHDENSLHEQMVKYLNDLSDTSKIMIWGGLESSAAQQLRHTIMDLFPTLTRENLSLISYWRKGFAEGEFKHHD